MGSSSSKFRKHLQNGDEFAALQLFNNSSDLRKGLDPNSSYGDTYNHDTPLHFASRHAMKSLLRIFLYELGGNPNKKNGRNESALHCVCMTPARSSSAAQRHQQCLQLVLSWRGAKLADGEVEKVDLCAQDEKLNTVLHYAAASGLQRCVEILVMHGGPLFMENALKQTPCDSAEKNGHNNIALYLESKMVFSNVEDESEGTDDLLDAMETEEGYSGLRAQDLQEAKDQLLVETSDMLRIPLFTAEALLRNHEWSRETLLESWMQNPIACCEKCGVVPPGNLFDDVQAGSSSTMQSPTIFDNELKTPTKVCPPKEEELLCDICASLIPPSEESVHMSCEHQFCRDCWKMYLTGKIKEGEAHNITCPGFDCPKLVPVEIIETLVSRDMARRYLQFDIKAFVESNPNIKWCPYPACGRAVKLPDSDNPLSPTFRDLATNKINSDTSHAVDCGKGHIFCWECLGEAHEPASCDNWKLWHQKIGEIKPEELHNTEEETEMAANCLWLVTNSKSCPNCKSPIQKNEGCNHMKCSKCKHDFCWVCLEPWKKHSSATGGYFRCNRYEVVRKVEDGTENGRTEAEAKNKKMQELNKFVHYYSRFKNHENSYKLEVPLVSTAKDKMLVLAKAVVDHDSANVETKFVEDAVHQLLKARRVLKCSYVYGYYLEEAGYKKPIFEFMQTELEECTETLSEMVARPYLRTPRSKIINTAHLVQRKRHEFCTAIAKGLVPPDTSPTLKKKRKKYSVELDDDLKKALVASLQDLDPANPWVKDPSGKHTNVSALLDWPEESDESDSESTQPKPKEETTPDILKTEDPNSTPSTGTTLPAFCIRAKCNRPRAQNPRTGETHDHCSIKCMRMDKLDKDRNEDAQPFLPVEYFNDYQIDLLRALEMSRLQFLRDMGSLRPGSGERSPRSPGSQLITTFPADPTSPGPSTSQTLVLCDPPRGRSPRPTSTGGNTPSVASGRNSPYIHEVRETPSPAPVTVPPEFDIDLQRALELSKMTLNEEEKELRMAIELSLKDDKKAVPGSPPPAPPPTAVPKEGHRSQQISPDPFSDEYSSVVTRVPNKSVDNLVRETNVDTIFNQMGPSIDTLGACGGHMPLNTEQEPAQPANGTNMSVLNYSGNQGLNPGLKANAFGIIKDISVANILPRDTDKTKEFENKDFGQFFVKAPTGNEQVKMEQVFEPRPPREDEVAQSPYDPWEYCQSSEATQQSGRKEFTYNPGSGSSSRNRKPKSPREFSYEEDACGPEGLSQSKSCDPNDINACISTSQTHQGNLNAAAATGMTSNGTHINPNEIGMTSNGAHKNPNEIGLDAVLQSLNTLTSRLTYDQSEVDNMNIDSQQIEAWLSGMEGYERQEPPRESTVTDTHVLQPPTDQREGEEEDPDDKDAVYV